MTINLLFTLDCNYLPQLEVALSSIWLNNSGTHFRIFVLHRSLDDATVAYLQAQAEKHGDRLEAISVEEHLFADAPVSKQYPQEMYYRMLAPHLLPKSVEKVLYLDPDILVINPLRPLWETDLQGHLFAAAAHSAKTELVGSVNRVRLGTDHDYFYSGVLLMNLVLGRERIVPQQLFDYAAAHTGTLILPDQDMLNVLFGDEILSVKDTVWNYDARDYRAYYLTSGGICDLDWVMVNTVVLHFCGKAKPWKKGYRYRFGLLYKHYEALARRQWTNLV